MEEIDGFFREGIPAKKWREQPRLSEVRAEEEKSSRDSTVLEVEPREKA